MHITPQRAKQSTKVTIVYKRTCKAQKKKDKSEKNQTKLLLKAFERALLNTCKG